MVSKQPITAVIAARLAEARKAMGLSQRGLGTKMGLSKAQGSARVNRYEHGVTFVTMKTLDSLSEALDVPRAALLADTAAIARAIRLLAAHDEETQAQLVDALARLAEEVPNRS